jgi:endonuclease/exonuclease/phosphatase family metal-dependent hydrolase
MRLATYNVEWFDTLFDNNGHLLLDEGWSSRRDVTRRAQTDALVQVFQALDADAIMVIEAPDTGRRRSSVSALENFAKYAGIRARKAITGFTNNTQQEIALLYDPDVVRVDHTPGEAPDAPRFDGVFHIDLDVDDTFDDVVFSKPPLELTLRANDTELQVLGVHIKSKAPHGAKSDADATRISIANRRKQLAQSIWLRRRVTQLRTQRKPVVVLGDFNDGPGLDRYEALFGRSSIEIVLGLTQPDQQQLFDPHARRALSGITAARDVTARFWLRSEKRFLSALLDYIMVSDDVRVAAQGWRIWHPFDDPDCYSAPDLRQALLTASDHFPVSLDLDLTAI